MVAQLRCSENVVPMHARLLCDVFIGVWMVPMKNKLADIPHGCRPSAHLCPRGHRWVYGHTSHIWEQQRGAGEHRDSVLLLRLVALATPAHSAHRPGRAWPRGPSGRLPAVIRVSNGRPDLPRPACALPCRRSVACCWSSVSLPAATAREQTGPAILVHVGHTDWYQGLPPWP
jgi:hypothetical protein